MEFPGVRFILGALFVGLPIAHQHHDSRRPLVTARMQQVLAGKTSVEDALKVIEEDRQAFVEQNAGG